LELVKTILPEDKAGVLDKLKFSFRDKKLLDRACEDLEQWQTRFLRRAVTYLFFGDLSISNKTDESARQDRVIERVKRIRAAITSEDAVTATVTLKLEDFNHVRGCQRDKVCGCGQEGACRVPSICGLNGVWTGETLTFDSPRACHSIAQC
jgi:hypothetical protein